MKTWPTTGCNGVPTIYDRFTHIASAIDLIQSRLLGQTRISFAKDELGQMAVERLFEVIGIASNNLPIDLKIEETGADWEAIANLSDRLGNAHDRIEPDVLWFIANEKLPALRACAERQLQRLKK